mgnify:CR=1 FL=1
MKRNVDGRPVPRHQAHRRAQAAARAFPADHDLIPPDAQLPDVILHIDQCRIAVLGCGRIGALNRQPITGGNDHRAELFDKVYRAGRMNHFLHSRNVPAAVNPQDADGVFRARLRGKHQRRDRTRIVDTEISLSGFIGRIVIHLALCHIGVTAFIQAKEFSAPDNLFHPPSEPQD